ncbi:MAG: hypothetical protein KF832_20245 [Caldilineaceae bacterium]|nr:hypothetical protein [Caldilineaceae bacterium]
MSDQFVEQAKANMNVLERLLKGLPGISGYVNKELRRDADKRLRELIATQLTEQKEQLFALQKQLLSNGGLRWLDEVDQIIQKLQIVTDRIRTATMGYAGLFDAVRIGEEQLATLHTFDTELANRVAALTELVTRLQTAPANSDTFQPALQELLQAVTAIDTLFNRRREAILSPDS